MIELTGKIRYKSQAKILNHLHIPFILNAASRPIVARATVERILGAMPNTTLIHKESRWKSAKVQ